MKAATHERGQPFPHGSVRIAGSPIPAGVKPVWMPSERASRVPALVGKNGDEKMSDPNERMGPGTYLTPEEAKEFHKLFVTSFMIFTIVAIIAHVLVWNWRPWL
jgi:light-harvesting complex 1 beta chain